ncbi:MAG: FHA domain-containing protein [Calothrix sp. CSU_2_0]|nr:FHA domain-containing protein [Calothrix sp. CSU_2_0]
MIQHLRDRIILGRNPQLCQIILAQEDLTISRLHAEIPIPIELLMPNIYFRIVPSAALF